MAVDNDDKRMATIKARTDVVLFVLEKVHYYPIIYHHKKLQKIFIKHFLD